MRACSGESVHFQSTACNRVVSTVLLYFSLSDLIISVTEHTKNREDDYRLDEEEAYTSSSHRNTRFSCQQSKFPALHYRNTSDGIKTPLQLLWAITISRSPNSDKSTQSQLLNLIFCDCASMKFWVRVEDHMTGVTNDWRDMDMYIKAYIRVIVVNQKKTVSNWQ